MVKKFITLLYLFLSGALLAQPITIDESKASIKFVFVDDDVEGTLSGFEFTGNIDLNNLSEADFSGSVAMETLDTNNWLRNRLLRSKKYFNKKEYPRLLFKSTSIDGGSGKEFLVRGELTIKGITKPVTLTFRHNPNSLYGGAVINASHFNINIHNESDRNMVSIRITLPFTAN